MESILSKQKVERDELMSRPYLQRTTRYDMQELLASPMIKLITGPRRVGKSVYALLLLRGQNFAYLNFDDKQLLDAWDEDMVESAMNTVYSGYEYILLDEIQNLDGWDLWVGKLFRRGKNLVITGSNANMLSSEMATVLTGRYLQVTMFPFSLEEAMEWMKSGNDDAVVADYLGNGGFPDTVVSRGVTRNYLSTLYDSMLLKDVAQRHRIRNTADLYTLANFLLSNFCNPFSANDLANDLGMSSVATVKKFMGYLHEPYLFYYLPRFNNKMKLMVKAPQKVYVVDNGFVAASAFNLSENYGRLLENMVFVELLRRGYETGKSLFYYRSRNDREVDFVTRRGAVVEELIQVCYDMTPDKTRKRELSAIVECGKELGCKRLTIVSRRQEEVVVIGDMEINVVPIAKF